MKNAFVGPSCKPKLALQSGFPRPMRGSSLGVCLWNLFVGGGTVVWFLPPFCLVWLRWFPTLPHPVGCSTIGVHGLSFQVRNGAGRFPMAMTTAKDFGINTVNDRALVFWVPLGFACWCPYTLTHSHGRLLTRVVLVCVVCVWGWWWFA